MRFNAPRGKYGAGQAHNGRRPGADTKELMRVHRSGRRGMSGVGRSAASEPMKYYKYPDEDSLNGSGVRFVEAEEGCSIREITVGNDSVLASNILYPHWGLMMSEGQADYDSIPEVTEIERSEFVRVWDAHLAQNAGRWLITRLAYPVGKEVKGYIAIFYPQGVLVDLGDAVVGVAGYRECRDSCTPECLYPRQAVEGVVGGYDEQNQWLYLSSPRVLTERKVDDE